MVPMHTRMLACATLLVLLPVACAQAPGPSSRRSAKGVPQEEAFLLRGGSTNRRGGRG